MWCQWSVAELRHVGRSRASGMVLAMFVAASGACDTEDGRYVFDPDSALPSDGGEAGDDGVPGAAGKGGRPAMVNSGGTGTAGSSASEGGSHSPAAAGGTAASGGGEPLPSGEAGQSAAASSGGATTSGGTGGEPPVDDEEAGAGGTATEPTAGAGGAAGGQPPTGGAGGEPVQPDTTPPTVVSTSPADGDDGIPGNVTIEVVFSEPIAPSSVSEDAFVVEQGGTAVSGTLSQSGNTVSFEPSEKLALLGEYTVTLTPELTDVAGNPLDDAPYEFGFQMADGVWKSAATLGAGLTPQVALDAQGNGVVAWLNGTSLWGAATDGGNGFQTPDDLPIGENVHQMRLATTGVQSAVAVWIEGARLRSSRFTSSGWTAAAFIDQGSGVDSSVDIELAANPNGAVVAVWKAFTSATNSRTIWSNRFSGTSWGAAAPVSTSTSTTGEYGAPLVAVAPSGTATVLYTFFDSQTDTLWSSSSAGSSWSTPKEVDSIARQDPTQSSILRSISQRALTVDSSGRFLGVWSIFTSGAGSDAPMDARYARTSAAGVWPAPTVFGDRRGGILLAGSPTGEALVALNYTVSAGVELWRYTPSGAWSELDGFPGISGGRGGWYMSIAADALGNGLLLWSAGGPSAARFVAGGSNPQWSTPADALATATIASLSVGVSSRGPGIASWSAGQQVTARRFDFAQ